MVQALQHFEQNMQLLDLPEPGSAVASPALGQSPGNARGEEAKRFRPGQISSRLFEPRLCGPCHSPATHSCNPLMEALKLLPAECQPCTLVCVIQSPTPLADRSLPIQEFPKLESYVVRLQIAAGEGKCILQHTCQNALLLELQVRRSLGMTRSWSRW